MKKALLAAFCVLALCLSSFAGTVSAFQVGYKYSCICHDNYFDENSQAMTNFSAVVCDGKWTIASEWGNASTASFGTNAVFRGEYETGYEQSNDSLSFRECIFVESADSTNDTGDFWQLCIDGAGNNGSAPQTDDYRIDIMGHRNVIWYQGNGTAWTVIGTPSTAMFQWNDSIVASPTSSTPHWICEIKFARVALITNVTLVTSAMDFGLRVATYDASNSSTGVQAWPPTSRDIPSDWGHIDDSYILIPEDLSLGAVVILSSFSLAFGALCSKMIKKKTLWKKGEKI